MVVKADLVGGDDEVRRSCAARISFPVIGVNTVSWSRVRGEYGAGLVVVKVAESLRRGEVAVGC